MPYSTDIIQWYAQDFTLSDQNADPDNWEWKAKSDKWTLAGEDLQNFRTKWYGAPEGSQSPSPEFLSLEPLPNLNYPILSPILVRDSYVTMFNTVWAGAISSGGKRGVIITGQPGIGKTMFLHYLLVRLLQRKQVVLFSLEGKMLHLFYHKEVYTAEGISLPLPRPKSKSLNVFIWSLFDIHEPREPDLFLIWDKQQLPMITGLPLWTCEELEQGLQHQPMYHPLLTALHMVYGSSLPNPSGPLDPLNVCLGARALLEEHYGEEDSVQPSPEDAMDYLLGIAIDRFGYSARDVFAAIFNYSEIAERHRGAFLDIKYTDLCAAVSSLFLFKQESYSDFMISNRIIALSPVDRGPLLSVRWRVDFKSSWVAKSMNRKLAEAEDKEILQQIRTLPSFAGGLVGWMLEPLAHHYITNPKNDFLLFNMNSNGDDPPHFTFVQDSPVPDNQRFTKVKRKIVRLPSIINLSNCLENTSYYVPDDPNFPLFDAFTIEFDREKRSAILWIIQMTMSRKHGGSAKGYQKIREIIAILKDELREDHPLKKQKTATEQAAPLVQVRYILVIPEDKTQSQNLQWDLPKGWSQNCSQNDHRGNVYCLEVPLAT